MASLQYNFRAAEAHARRSRLAYMRSLVRPCPTLAQRVVAWLAKVLS